MKRRPGAAGGAGGISAALHVGKLPPACRCCAKRWHRAGAGGLPAVAGAGGRHDAGTGHGRAADALGARRTMVLGLVLLSAGELRRRRGDDAPALLALRAWKAWASCWRRCRRRA
jgi:hypothetical protein